jgi:hypothetical protein
MSYQRLLTKQITNVSKRGINPLWGFPLAVFGGWILFPALDYDWKISVGLEADPEAPSNAVQAAKDARREAFEKAKGQSTPATQEEDDDDVEEEDTAEPEEEQEAEEEPTTDGDENEESEESEEEEAEEEEEEEKIEIKPLYMPTKGKNLTPQDIWDNFTSKAVRMSEDDDDDDDDEGKTEATQTTVIAFFLFSTFSYSFIFSLDQQKKRTKNDFISIDHALHIYFRVSTILLATLVLKLIVTYSSEINFIS